MPFGGECLSFPLNPSPYTFYGFGLGRRVLGFGLPGPAVEDSTLRAYSELLKGGYIGDYVGEYYRGH